MRRRGPADKTWGHSESWEGWAQGERLSELHTEILRQARQTRLKRHLSFHHSDLFFVPLLYHPFSPPNSRSQSPQCATRTSVKASYLLIPLLPSQSLSAHTNHRFDTHTASAVELSHEHCFPLTMKPLPFKVGKQTSPEINRAS